MKNFRSYFIIIFIIALVIALSQNGAKFFADSAKEFLAGVFFVSSITEEELLEKYIMAENGNEKIKILIVPGHDDGIGGTSFRGVQERDLNIEIAEEVTKLLRQQREFEVSLTKNKEEYHQEIASYLIAERESIVAFRQKHKNIMETLIASGLIDTRKRVEHNVAPTETVLRLYGINRWANENDIDIIIHIHLNDYHGRRYNEEGKYSGLVIYVPERQFSNSEASRALAQNVFDKLTTYFAQSDIIGESAGIIEDQELIAIGAYNTLDSAVLFIEYGYIYESQFINPQIRAFVIKELATQTYLGILDFFDIEKSNSLSVYSIATLPYFFGNNLKNGMRKNIDVFAMQIALSLQSLYPPVGKSKNDCPINGNFGTCTTNAVIAFQKKYAILPAVGYVGPITRLKLNELFNPQ